MATKRYTKATWEAVDDAVVMVDNLPTSIPRVVLARVALGVAWFALVHAPAGDNTPLRALLATEAYLDGRGTVDAVRRAARATRKGGVHSNARDAAFYAARVVYDGDALAVSAVTAAAAAVADAAAGTVRRELGVGVWYAALNEAKRRLADVIRAALPWDVLAAA